MTRQLTAAGGNSPPSREARRTVSGRRARVGWLFSTPFAIVFALFMLGPIVASLAMSFTDFRAADALNPLAVNFVGFDAYAEIFNDPRFLQSLRVTGLFVVLGIPTAIVIALALAVALNNGIRRFRSFFRVGFYAPVVTSIIGVSVVWRYLLQPDGLINTALSWIGVTGPNWLHSTTWALPSLVALAVWRNVGTLMVIFIAGLQSIPENLLEAASVDGAGTWRRFWSVTLPMLRPTILLGTVLVSVGFLQFFEEAFVMTQGGPLDSTLSISYYTFQQFGQGRYAQASAAAYVLFTIMAALSVLQFRLLRRQD